MVHGDGTRADGRRFGYGAPFVEDGELAEWRSREDNTEDLIKCSEQSGRLSGPSYNRSASNANLFYNPPVWGLSGAPRTYRRPRRTGKSVDCE